MLSFFLRRSYGGHGVIVTLPRFIQWENADNDMYGVTQPKGLSNRVITGTGTRVQVLVMNPDCPEIIYVRTYEHVH